MQASEQTPQRDFEGSRGGWMLIGRLLLWSMRNCRHDEPDIGTSAGRAIDLQALNGSEYDAAA